ncbi:hypothetical protein STEG23_032363, partial [Scotinomys teguina]
MTKIVYLLTFPLPGPLPLCFLFKKQQSDEAKQDTIRQDSKLQMVDWLNTGYKSCVQCVLCEYETDLKECNTVEKQPSKYSSQRAAFAHLHPSFTQVLMGRSSEIGLWRISKSVETKTK